MPWEVPARTKPHAGIHQPLALARPHAAGESILTVRILVYVAGVAPKSAVGMSMAIVGGDQHSRKLCSLAKR
jgi:hypothetical protein